jgi:hypothetical protein
MAVPATYGLTRLLLLRAECTATRTRKLDKYTHGFTDQEAEMIARQTCRNVRSRPRKSKGIPEKREELGLPGKAGVHVAWHTSFRELRIREATDEMTYSSAGLPKRQIKPALDLAV